jgi:hypothetical protein
MAAPAASLVPAVVGRAGDPCGGTGGRAYRARLSRGRSSRVVCRISLVAD